MNTERPYDFWIVRFDPNNGTNGMVPIYPREWARVGLDTDVKCFNLLKFLYGQIETLTVCNPLVGLSARRAGPT